MTTMSLPDLLGALLTDEQVGAYIGKSTRTVRRLVVAGRLECVRVGQSPRFRAEAVDRYLKEQSEQHQKRAAAAKPAKPTRNPNKY